MTKSFARTAILISFLAFSLMRCAFFSETGRDVVHNPSRAKTRTAKPAETERKSPAREAYAPERLEVVDYAKQLLGTEYRYGGKNPRTGFDCSGFTQYVMGHFGVDLSASSRYQAKEGEKVDVKNVKPGDLIFFKRTPASQVFHVSMVVENSKEGIKAIHSTSRGVVIDNISKSDYWRPKISSARSVLQE